MAAKPKLALTPPTSIPLDKLVLSDANVRQTNAGVSIEALAESIARRGLLQSLSVRPVLDVEGNETGSYGVQAGGRRWRALKLLVKQKRLAKDAPIACIVKTTGIVEDDSLAENTEREALHPLDQFRAFAALRDKGQSDEDIAAAFAVTPAVVRQRLKLAVGKPEAARRLCRRPLELEQLMAFCVTDDHARQEQVLDTIMQRQIARYAYKIRRLLTETCVEADDPARPLRRPRCLCGRRRDDHARPVRGRRGRLAAGPRPSHAPRLREARAASANASSRQGWKWVEAALELPYDLRLSLRRLQPDRRSALDRRARQRYEALVRRARQR